ncbi:MAG: flagellar export protein FliJ [Pseudomonas sp.]
MNQTPLDTLIDLAREARDGAARLLAGERHGERQLADQLALLESYRNEYRERLHEQMRSGMDSLRLQDYQGFLVSLDNAIIQAGSAMGEQRQRVTLRQQQWQQEQRRLTSYDTLAQRRNAERRREEARREQRDNDEFTTNTVARRSATRSLEQP